MEQIAWQQWEKGTEEERRQLLRDTQTQDARAYACYLREEMPQLEDSLCQEVAIFLASMHYQLERELLALEEAGRASSQAYHDLLAIYRSSGFLAGLEDLDAEA